MTFAEKFTPGTAAVQKSEFWVGQITQKQLDHCWKTTGVITQRLHAQQGGQNVQQCEGQKQQAADLSEGL